MAIPIDDFVAATESAKSYLSRFQSAMSEYQQTGNWMGEKYGVAFSDAGVPATRTKEAISQFEVDGPGFIEKNFGEERFERRLSELQDNIGRAGFREERKRIRVAQNITDVEDFSQEDWKALVTRNEELKSLKQSDPLQFSKMFNAFDQTAVPGTADETLSYLVHAGAPELQGGKLDPNFTKGSDIIGSGAAGDTKAANMSFVKLAKDEIFKMEKEAAPGFERRLEAAKRQVAVIEEGGGFMSAGRASGGMAGGYFGRTEWQRGCKI